MTRSKIIDEPQLAELRSKYGEDAPLYAEVRAEAAAASGRPESSQEWEEAADELSGEDDRGDESGHSSERLRLSQVNEHTRKSA